MASAALSAPCSLCLQLAGPPECGSPSVQTASHSSGCTVCLDHVFYPMSGAWWWWWFWISLNLLSRHNGILSSWTLSILLSCKGILKPKEGILSCQWPDGGGSSLGSLDALKECGGGGGGDGTEGGGGEGGGGALPFLQVRHVFTPAFIPVTKGMGWKAFGLCNLHDCVATTLIPIPLLLTAFPAISLLHFSAFSIFSDLQPPHSSPLRLFKPWWSHHQAIQNTPFLQVFDWRPYPQVFPFFWPQCQSLDAHGGLDHIFRLLGLIPFHIPREPVAELQL